MADITSAPTENDERKLWFEYVKVLNERQLQKAQRSGITTYVLVATVIGLLYRFGPHIPGFVSEPGNVRAGIAIFALLEVAVGSFFMSILGVELFCAGESEFRATPKSNEAVIPLVAATAVALAAAVITLEVWTAMSTFSGVKLTKYVLLGHAVWLVVNVVTPIVLYRRRSKKAKDVKNPVPRFDLFRLPRSASLPGAGLLLIWSVLGAVSLIRFLQTLPGFGIQALKAASLSLIVMAIVGYMILRSIASAVQQKFFALERDIVLNNMTAAEIRERYLWDLSGPDMAQWLDESLVALERKEDRLQHELDSSQAKIKEISGISKDYLAERKERATQTTEKLRKALLECLYQYDVLTFQSDVFVQSYRTPEENEALGKRLKGLREKHDKFKVTADNTMKVLDQLGEITK
ncbi:MAG TPA: hypothetical protein VGR55_10965 [Candidatus Acidoferrum sp.]|nr:hypothetical protein [Candidatus Acidoferrum sp.]